MKHTPKKRPTEKPKQTAYRLYGVDRRCLKKMKRAEKVSESEAVRRSIRIKHNAMFPDQKVPEQTVE